MTDPSHHFDFWIGEWEVRDPNGTLAGRNRIERLYETGSLRETWVGAGGLRGTSLNAYDAGRRCWHQTWVDSSGAVLLLDGGLRDGAMVLEGTTPSEDERDELRRHRITWSVQDGDPVRVRQHWEVSQDGSTWETAFDGRYARVPDDPPND